MYTYQSIIYFNTPGNPRTTINNVAESDFEQNGSIYCVVYDILDKDGDVESRHVEYYPTDKILKIDEVFTKPEEPGVTLANILREYRED